MTLAKLALFSRLQAPAGDGTDGGGGSADRGDDFTPTGDDAAGGTNADILAAARSGPKDDDKDDKGGKADDKDAAGKDDQDDKDDKGAKGDDKGRDDKGRFIPKSRFDDAVGKERSAREAAERRNAELQAQLDSVAKSADVGKLEEEVTALEATYSKLVVDGDHEKAAQVMSQIRLKERAIGLSQTENMTAAARAAAAEEVRMDMAITALEESYSVMDPNHEDYDQDVVDIVLGQQRLLIERDRMAPSKALAKAASTVMLKLMPAAKEEPAAAKGLGAAKGDAKADDRAAKGKAKNLEAALKTPPALGDVGKDTDKAGMTNGAPVLSSVEDLKDLPDATKRRLRGDML